MWVSVGIPGRANFTAKLQFACRAGLTCRMQGELVDESFTSSLQLILEEVLAIFRRQGLFNFYHRNIQ